ncbi:uncharacterized protein C8Q71DRAFT_538691 [Rhodofomes roseus]|uniref:Uncharacterized protein n=1 Tax=Rhodofomes roseus TaxID=34475 RepID=A0ABQ8KM03_9APHY|nr:uncharacterized protein C8Q71DRAFT_538691 [Rhodofomes roseus]KAH9838617.1 hypothetical protein C8Q71DRAFT_538691 [Rhodofomes roseus]
MSFQPVLMWQEQDVCPYSNLFFSGLRMIATRPASVIVNPSAPSPIEPESSKVAGKRPAHFRNGSYPQQEYPAPRTAHPRINTDTETLDMRVQRPRNESSTSSRHADGLHGRAKSRRDAIPSYSKPSSSGRPISRDSDRESIASSHTDIDYITSPLNSFLCFHPSPTDSTASLVSPRRERRRSLESTKTVPLPPKRTSRAEKRRSIMSVIDIRSPSPNHATRGQEGTANGLPAHVNVRSKRSSVGGWADEVLRDWRQRVDSPSQEDQSFLITS